MIRLAVIALVCFISAESQQQGRPFDIFDQIPLPRQNFAQNFPVQPARKQQHFPIQPAGVPARKIHIQQPTQRFQPAVPARPSASLTAHFDQLLLDAERQEQQAAREEDVQQRQQNLQQDQLQRERERKVEKLEALRDLYTDFPELAPARLPAGTPVAAAPSPSRPQPVVKPVRPAPKPVGRPLPQFQQSRTRFSPQPRPETRPRFQTPEFLRPRPAAPKPQPAPTRPQPINIAQILQPAQVQPARAQPQPPRPKPQPVRPQPIEVKRIAKPAPGKLFERPQPVRPTRPQVARPAPRPAAPVRPAPVRVVQQRPAARPLPTFNERQQQTPIDAGRPIVQSQRVFGKQHTTLTAFSDVGLPLEPLVDELGPTPKPFIDILKTYQRKNADGTFTFGYTGEDGSFKEETRGTDCVVRGKYGYIDPEGMRREYTYVTGNPCDPNAPSLVNPDDPESLVPGGYYDYERDVYVTPEGQEVQLSLKRKGGHRRRFQ